MKGVFWQGAAAFAGVMLSGIASATPEPDVAEANVLVIRTIDGEDGSQAFDGAKLIPLKVELPFRVDGEVDVDRLIASTKDGLGAAKSLDLVADQLDHCPDGVTRIFDEVEEAQEAEALSWRSWTPWGRVGSGFYGYGQQRYWGGYRGYYPSYGYFTHGRAYPFRYGGYHCLRSYGFHYYYRY